MKTYTLPISRNYVANWGLWEAIREIIQNAYDAQDSIPDCIASITYELGTLSIKTSKGTITPSSLVLGNTTKADDHNQRGKFGEGYKLALLVLTRLERTVLIRTEKELWVPFFGYNQDYESEVLEIQVYQRNHSEGVTFEIAVEADEWLELKANIIKTPEQDTIIHDALEKGRVYVGGLYVCEVEEFKAGYSLLPSSIQLDRDRQAVSDYDLQGIAGRLWSQQSSDNVAKLLYSGAKDTAYSHYYVEKSSPIVEKVYSDYVKDHPDTVPVSSQVEIEKATAAGVKWKLVPEVVKSLLSKVKIWLIPTTKSPLDRLKDFKKQHRYSFTSEMNTEFDDIIKTLEGVA